MDRYINNTFIMIRIRWDNKKYLYYPSQILNRQRRAYFLEIRSRHAKSMDCETIVDMVYLTDDDNKIF